MVTLFDKLTCLTTDHDIIDVTRNCLVRNINLAKDKVLNACTFDICYSINYF